MVDNIDVLAHSCIRVRASDGTVAYFDPYLLDEAPHDADVVFLTHDHYDHFSPEDLARVANDATCIVAPATTVDTLAQAGVDRSRIVAAEPGQALEAAGLPVECVRAYNIGKDFHPRANNWLGYVLTVDGVRIYVAGDTDITPENRQVKCDVALVPVGGTYTMTAQEAARLVNEIRPKVAIPTHYGAIVGTKEDGKVFAEHVDEGIDAVIKLRYDDNREA